MSASSSDRRGPIVATTRGLGLLVLRRPYRPRLGRSVPGEEAKELVGGDNLTQKKEHTHYAPPTSRCPGPSTIQFSTKDVREKYHQSVLRRGTSAVALLLLLSRCIYQRLRSLQPGQACGRELVCVQYTIPCVQFVL